MACHLRIHKQRALNIDFFSRKEKDETNALGFMFFVLEMLFAECIVHLGWSKVTLGLNPHPLNLMMRSCA